METKVIYNDTCPICSREIAAYRRYAEACDLPVTFAPLGEGGRRGTDLTEDGAARRLHVVRDGQILAGLPAFVALWDAMPRFRWLARLVSLPGIRTVADLVYEWILAPALFALHRWRVRRRTVAQLRDDMR
ncbi:MAG: DUF393 domain-containing protein [Acidobacteriota bacterium]